MARVINTPDYDGPIPPVFLTSEEFLAFVDELGLVPSFMLPRQVTKFWHLQFLRRFQTINEKKEQRAIARVFIEHFTTRYRQRTKMLDLQETEQLDLF